MKRRVRSSGPSRNAHSASPIPWIRAGRRGSDWPVKSAQPVEPRPSDFGLTDERARRLADPFSRLLHNGWTWLGLISVIVVIAYARTESLLLAVLSLILWVPLTLFLGVPSMMIVSAVWRRVQP